MVTQPSDDNLPPYGPPYHDTDIIHHTVNNIVKDHPPKKTRQKDTEFLPVQTSKKNSLHSKIKPNFGSVGYQQIITHGINTYYDIPKNDENIEELKFEDEGDTTQEKIKEEEKKSAFSTDFKIKKLKPHENTNLNQFQGNWISIFRINSV